MACADPEKQREYQRKWRAANREKIREYDRKRREENPDEYREYYRKWSDANLDKLREYKHQWYVENFDKRREYNRKRRKEHREESRKCYERLRAKVLALLGGKCARCGIDDPIVLQVDHINGGGTAEQRSLGVQGVYRKALKDPSPYQLLCANCNVRKRYENGECRKKV